MRCTFEKAQQHYVTYSTGATRSVNTNAHSREGKRYGSPSAVIAAKAEGNARARSSCSTYTSAYTAQQVANALLSSFRCSHARFSNSLATPRFSVPFRHASNLAWVLAFTTMTAQSNDPVYGDRRATYPTSTHPRHAHTAPRTQKNRDDAAAGAAAGPSPPHYQLLFILGYGTALAAPVHFTHCSAHRPHASCATLSNSHSQTAHCTILHYTTQNL